MTLNVPMRLTPTVRANVSSGSGPARPTMRPAVAMPAQWITIRKGPCASRERVRRRQHVGLARDVRFDGDAADFRGDALGRFGITVDDRHAPAARCKTASRSGAEARGAAGDDRGEVVRIHQAIAMTAGCSTVV